MTNQHTPGPWGWEEDKTSPEYFTVKSSNDKQVCIMQSSTSDMGMKSDPNVNQCKANARLIAAAPELLEALEILLAQVKPYTDGDGAAMHHAQNIAAKAIKKAKGE